MIYLVDKSAWEQRRHSDHAEHRLVELMREGLAGTCQMVMLEMLYSARNRRHYGQLSAWLRRLPELRTGDDGLDRALHIQEQMADRGQHRCPLPVLIIAATAEQHGAIVLHYDRDFDLIARFTGQHTEWIVQCGQM